MSDYMRALRAKIGNDLVNSPAVTGIVFDERGHLLVVRHSDGNIWVGPGGAVEPGEAPADAVVREVWEETGLWVEPVMLLGAFGGPEFRVRYSNGDELAFVMAVYECRVLGGTLRHDGVETLEARFMAPAELERLPLAPWARIVLPLVVANRGGPCPPAVSWRPPLDR